MKTVERERARSLRIEQGRSVKEIARELAVSTSTVSRWVRDVALTSEQQAALRAHGRGDRVAAGRTNRERARGRRAAWQEEARARASDKPAIHMAGCMLFWAEGSCSRNSVYFTNSDPAMVRFFLVQAHETASVRDVQAEPALDPDRPAHLRGDPGVRGVRPAGVARLSAQQAPPGMRRSTVHPCGRASRRSHAPGHRDVAPASGLENAHDASGTSRVEPSISGSLRSSPRPKKR